MDSLHSSFHIDGPVVGRLGGAWAAWHGHGAPAAAALRGQLPYGARVQAAAAAMAAAAAYLLALRRLPPGGRRLAAALPLLPLNAALPLLFDPSGELLSRAVATACFTWLASCKAAALCINRGPLAAPGMPVLSFCLCYAMPIIPRSREAAGRAGRLSDSAGSPPHVAAMFAWYSGLVVALAWLLSKPLPILLRQWGAAFGLYAFLCFIMGGAVALLGLVSIEVVPPFDRPWLATSLADFWGRRWNNTVSLTLRPLFYDPIVEGRLVAPPPPPPAVPVEHSDDASAAAAFAAAAAGAPAPAGGAPGGGGAARGPRKQPRAVRSLATLSTFAASGLFHELLFFYFSEPYVWGISNFFLVQVLLTQLELEALNALKARGAAPPRAARMLLVQATLLATGYFYFWPAIDAGDNTGRFVAAVARNARAAAAALGLRAPV
ncbi:MAG: hypothetical protein J3K34DRAFT_517551 [Monoraphidium minutum]|nr:MAG: hypothetical protein J3K34DRAFT_517551 [Monoraphidium minutum]